MSVLPNSDGVAPPTNGQPESHWVVQKFGGTSVGKFAFNIVDQVIRYVVTARFNSP